MYLKLLKVFVRFYFLVGYKHSLIDLYFSFIEKNGRPCKSSAL